jgi:hypothetical protein
MLFVYEELSTENCPPLLAVTAYSRYVLAGILHNCGGLALQFGALKKIAPSKTLLRFPSYNGIRFAFCNMFS